MKGRSHATAHHYVAERFFGRSKNRKDTRERIFECCPWAIEGESAVYCYECHEELLHNPVLLPEDMKMFAELVRRAGLDEDVKPHNRIKIAGRIRLLHDVISAGIKSLSAQEDLSARTS